MSSSGCSCISFLPEKVSVLCYLVLTPEKPNIIAEQTMKLCLIFLLGQNSSKAGAHAVDGQRHCLIMDEVDGMAGNEDRGGMQVQACELRNCITVILHS